MPVHLTQKNGKYCVTEPDGTVKKCYDSREEALKYLRAINMHVKKKASEDSLKIKASEVILGEHTALPIQILSDGTVEGTAVMLNGTIVPFSRMEFYCSEGEYGSCSMSITLRDSDNKGTTVERTFQLRNSKPIEPSK